MELELPVVRDLSHYRCSSCHFVRPGDATSNYQSPALPEPKSDQSHRIGELFEVPVAKDTDNADDPPEENPVKRVIYSFVRALYEIVFGDN